MALKPDLQNDWRELGDLLTLVEDVDGADAAYARHVAYAVQDKRLIQAGIVLSEGRLEIAEPLLRAHLEMHPTDVAAIRMLAETGTRLGR